jgi:hypothetical protein
MMQVLTLTLIVTKKRMAEYRGGFRLIQFDIPNKCAIDKDPGHSAWRNDLKARIYDYAVDTKGSPLENKIYIIITGS